MKYKKNNIINKQALIFLTLIVFGFFLIFLSIISVSAEAWIGLNGTSEVRVNDSNSLDGFSKATWNMWVKEDMYNNNAGILGKYSATTGGRSYLIRTSLKNGTSIIISKDGINSGSYTSALGRACGVRENNKWTMITLTYDGSLIKYYRNGVLCDQDQTLISSVYNSYSPLRFGGGNSIFFNGGIDEFTIYDENLASNQIVRLYNESVYGSDLGQSIPVLVYHKIEEPAKDLISVSPAQFQQQMEYLNQNDFQTITLSDYATWRDGNYNLPKKAIILVFDDGFLSVYNTAKPIMDQYGFVGSVITVTRYASFTSNTSGYMKWFQIKDLSDYGWSIESHGLTHSHMLTLSESQFRNELLSSKQIITNMTGKTPLSFVFPFHESNKTYANICGEYYPLCWTQGSLNPTYDFKSTPGKEYLSLRRINVAYLTTFKEFNDFLRRDTDKAGEWIMEEGSGNTTADTSGNKNLGKLLNGASWYFVESNTLKSAIASLNNYNVKISSVNENSINKKDNIDNIIDSDKGKAPMKLQKEKNWPDNMDIEGDYYKNHDPIKLEKENKESKKNN